MTEKEKIKAIVKATFKDENGEPFELSDGQCDIFGEIYFKKHNRVQIIAPTQYGKSNTVAMAIILRSQKNKEDWTILTGQQKKSEVIMGKVIDHLFDCPILLENLELDSKEPLDRIRRERSKKKITWKDGGYIEAITADARNRQRVKEGLSGLGSPNIIEDESSLIPDDLQVMILRMLGGHKGGFLMKIGNPYLRNHFLKTWRSDKYYKVFIDYNQGLKESRYTPEFIEEMRGEFMFSVLYECKFPEENEIDERGYYLLVSDKTLEFAFTEAFNPEGEIWLGVDIGRGGNLNAFICRTAKVAWLENKNQSADLMSNVVMIQKIVKKYGDRVKGIFIDDVGVGGGVVDRCKELGINVEGIREGAKAKNEDKFANIKSENYWDLKMWIDKGGKLVKNEDFYQLTNLKYKVDTSGKMKTEPKEEMRKRGIESPDIADALSLTFNQTNIPNIRFL